MQLFAVKLCKLIKPSMSNFVYFTWSERTLAPTVSPNLKKQGYRYKSYYTEQNVVKTVKSNLQIKLSNSEYTWNKNYLQQLMHDDHLPSNRETEKMWQPVPLTNHEDILTIWLIIHFQDTWQFDFRSLLSLFQINKFFSL